PITKLKVLGPASGNGTVVRWRADREIFPKTRYQLETIETRLRELAYLNPGLVIRLKDERGPDDHNADRRPDTRQVGRPSPLASAPIAPDAQSGEVPYDLDNEADAEKPPYDQVFDFPGGLAE